MGLSGVIPILFTLTICVYSVFLQCYFPLKKSVEGYSTHEKILKWIESSVEAIPLSFENAAHYDKTVIMLVDALRADFVFHENSTMDFVGKLLQYKENEGFIAEAHPPTVTLPRIKALTTGSIPGFVDVVLNFGSTSLQEDNILLQMINYNKKVVFYGDDTWIRLFPEYFARSDGTNSFFVNDYTEVDNNVTRHLSTELENGDFDVMILHYLGLDHIGHTAGPSSPLVAPKLREMDNIVKMLHKGLAKLQKPGGLPNLLVVCGDHGMSDQGSHGGSSYSETRVPIVFLSTNVTNKNNMEGGLKAQSEIDQIDFPPTLSVMLGLPIPQNNLGKVITKALSRLSVEQVLESLLQNSAQILQVLKQNVANYQEERGYELFQKATKSHSQWLKIYNNTDMKYQLTSRLITQYTDAMEAMTKQITTSMTTYDMYGLVVTIIILWEILIVLLLIFFGPVDLSWSFQWTIISSILLLCLMFCHITICTSHITDSDLLCGGGLWSLSVQCGLLLVIIYLTVCIAQLVSHTKKRVAEVLSCSNILGWFLIGGTVLHSISLLSSSFVEEEHQTWYFLSITVHFVLLVHVLIQRSNKTSYRSTLQSDNCVHTTSSDRLLELSRNTHYDECRMNTNSHSDGSCETRFTKLKKKTKDTNDEQNSNKCSAKLGKRNESAQHLSDFVYHKLLHREMAGILIIICLSRISRSWNQTGNKWLDQPDIGDWLVSPENKQVLTLLVMASMILILILKWHQVSWLQRAVLTVFFVSAYWYRAVSGVLYYPFEYSITQGILPARVAFLAIVIFVASSMFPLFNRQDGALNKTVCPSQYRILHTAWILLMVLLMRPHNVILVAMVTLQENIMYEYLYSWLKSLSPAVCTLIFLWMGNALFFYQGNSNSISTIDVSAGYIGLEDYNPVAVGILLALSTYSGIIFWLLSLVRFISCAVADEKLAGKPQNTRNTSLWYEVCHTLAVSCCLPLSVYTVLVVLLRHHLFVWTVFSPKLLYEGMKTLVIFIFSLILIIFT